MNKKQDGRKNNGGAGRNQGRTKDYPGQETYRHQVTVPLTQKIPFTEHVEKFLKPLKNKKP